MQTNVLPVDSLVDVTSYGPFRGLKGTIRQVDAIEALPDEPFCFYLVALEGAQIKEPVWFECEEVEQVAPLSVAADDLFVYRGSNTVKILPVPGILSTCT
jgi:hypothetical protein